MLNYHRVPTRVWFWLCWRGLVSCIFFGPLGQLWQLWPHARYNQLTWWLEHSRKDWSFPDFSGLGGSEWNQKIMETSFYGQQTTGKWRWAAWTEWGHQHPIEPMKGFGYPNPKTVSLNPRLTHLKDLVVIFRISYQPSLHSIVTPQKKIGVYLKMGYALK